MSTLSSSNKQEMSPGYQGEYLLDRARIVRDKETKAAKLELAIEGEWQLYAGPSVDTINFSQALLEGNGAGEYPIPVSNSVRSYFELVTEAGTAILAENHLPMSGGYNFRDLGGIRTQEGNYVKWGKLFRSDDLHSLTDTDLTYLESLPIKTVVDFRSEDEKETSPNRLPTTVTASYPYSMNPGNMSDLSSLFGMMANGMDAMMEQMNVDLVSDPINIKPYHDFFALLQSEENLPLLYHCSAGKDRTGMATALILYALHVDEQTIFDNYLASNTYLGNKYAQYIEQFPQFKAMFQVKTEYLQAGINHIRENYGSVENYLETILQVDIQKLRELYLD